MTSEEYLMDQNNLHYYANSSLTVFDNMIFDSG